MNISYNDFARFSLAGQLRLIHMDGDLLLDLEKNGTAIQLYKIYDFFVEIVPGERASPRIRPIFRRELVEHYFELISLQDLITARDW